MNVINSERHDKESNENVGAGQGHNEVICQGAHLSEQQNGAYHNAIPKYCEDDYHTEEKYDGR